jgi:hypothetical protein
VAAVLAVQTQEAETVRAEAETEALRERLKIERARAAKERGGRRRKRR